MPQRPGTESRPYRPLNLSCSNGGPASPRAVSIASPRERGPSIEVTITGQIGMRRLISGLTATATFKLRSRSHRREAMDVGHRINLSSPPHADGYIRTHARFIRNRTMISPKIASMCLGVGAALRREVARRQTSRRKAAPTSFGSGLQVTSLLKLKRSHLRLSVAVG